MRLYIIQSLKLGTRSFVRNGLLVTLTVIAIIGIQIIFMAGLFGKTVFNYALSAVERRVDVRLSLVTDAPNESVERLHQTIESMPHVYSVRRVASESIYTSFKERHSDDFLTLQALQELQGNPFGEELVIKLDSASYYNTFLTELSNPEVFTTDLVSIIEDTDTDRGDEMVRRLINFERTASNIGWVVIVASFGVMVLVLSVVSRLFLSQYTADITVMRTYGVSESHIGAWLCVTYSLCIVLATTISVLCVAGLFSLFDTYMGSLAAGLSLSTWFQTNLVPIVGFVFFTSIAVVHMVTLFFLTATPSKRR